MCATTVLRAIWYVLSSWVGTDNIFQSQWVNSVHYYCPLVTYYSIVYILGQLKKKECLCESSNPIWIQLASPLYWKYLILNFSELQLFICFICERVCANIWVEFIYELYSSVSVPNLICDPKDCAVNTTNPAVKEEFLPWCWGQLSVCDFG